MAKQTVDKATGFVIEDQAGYGVNAEGRVIIPKAERGPDGGQKGIDSQAPLPCRLVVGLGSKNEADYRDMGLVTVAELGAALGNGRSDVNQLQEDIMAARVAKKATQAPVRPPAKPAQTRIPKPAVPVPKPAAKAPPRAVEKPAKIRDPRVQVTFIDEHGNAIDTYYHQVVQGEVDSAGQFLVAFLFDTRYRSGTRFTPRVGKFDVQVTSAAGDVSEYSLFSTHKAIRVGEYDILIMPANVPVDEQEAEAGLDDFQPDNPEVEAEESQDDFEPLEDQP